jgi:hypothetical protein
VREPRSFTKRSFISDSTNEKKITKQFWHEGVRPRPIEKRTENEMKNVSACDILLNYASIFGEEVHAKFDGLKA